MPNIKPYIKDVSSLYWRNQIVDEQSDVNAAFPAFLQNVRTYMYMTPKYLFAFWVNVHALVVVCLLFFKIKCFRKLLSRTLFAKISSRRKKIAFSRKSVRKRRDIVCE